MESLYRFGYPTAQRIQTIRDLKANSTEFISELYQGKLRRLPVIEVRIQVLTYRIENIRTKNLQKEFLATHPEYPRDFFISDPGSIEVQTVQHSLLKELAAKDRLIKYFEVKKNQTDINYQKYDLICSDQGVVVNGNRRLCAWRELFYSDQEKYKHFQTVKVAVLPNHDPQGLYDLEVALQIEEPQKADYAWHAIAADSKEKLDAGVPIEIIARKRNMKPDEVRNHIECYNYANEYLKAIGHEDEWSLTDHQKHAFEEIVKGRENLEKPGDKALFGEITSAMLQMPAKGDRLYNQIPQVAKYLSQILPKLIDVFNISGTVEEDDENIDLLLGTERDSEDMLRAQVAAEIKEADNPALIVDTVTSVIHTVDEIEKEKKKQDFVSKQVAKAAQLLQNVISNIDDSMIKEGVAKDIESIEGSCVILKDWVRDK